MPAGFYRGKNRLIPATGINLPTLVITWFNIVVLYRPMWCVFASPSSGWACRPPLPCGARSGGEGTERLPQPTQNWRKSKDAVKSDRLRSTDHIQKYFDYFLLRPLLRLPEDRKGRFLPLSGGFRKLHSNFGTFLARRKPKRVSKFSKCLIRYPFFELTPIAQGPLHRSWEIKVGGFHQNGFS